MCSNLLAGADKIITRSEAHVLSDSIPDTWKTDTGTTLEKTVSTDVVSRLPYAIDPESVTVHSTPDGGVTYREGVDYSLDHIWGGLSRIETGAILSGATVYIDYDVYLERIDAVQISKSGEVTIKKGDPAPVCSEITEPDKGCALLARIYVPYRTMSIDESNVYCAPREGVTWHDFIRIDNSECLRNTRRLLQDGKQVTVVCWGDSMTEHYSASDPSKCYVEVFRSRLQAAYPKSDIEVINAGIAGSNTGTGIDVFHEEVLAHHPDMITVEFVNDVCLTPERVSANFARFISEARSANPEVEITIITPHYLCPNCMANFETVVPAMRKAADEHKVALADVTSIWENLRSLGIPYMSLLANGINHSGDLGHEFFAETLARLVVLEPTESKEGVRFDD